MLGSEMTAIDDFRIIRARAFAVCYVVAKLIERFHDDVKGITLIVTLQIFYVFQNKNCRLFCPDDPGHIKEERTLSVALETVFATHRVLFTDTGDAEWLAWKSRKKNIMIRDRGIDKFVCLVISNLGPVAKSDVTDV
ncbi:hypothetical protein MUTS5_05240 (plasmid) [Escherichia coli]|nr:hypothetical protein MUTS5_05240 [Escherichia coli]BDY57045.1 hypothetical protein MUTS6_01840 [Escherichia coli]BDY62216.1 hypothetical protein MUTS7_04570 [Escherichia coli]